MENTQWPATGRSWYSPRELRPCCQVQRIRKPPDATHIERESEMVNSMTQRLTQEDIRDILQAFEHSGFAHLDLTFGSVRVAVNQVSTAAICSDDLPKDTAQVDAPLLGMFQAGPEAGAPAFVRPGTKVKADTTIGIIRVMENQMAVKAGQWGTVVDVLVQDGQFVEFGQPLLRVSTASEASGSYRPESNGANVR